MQSGGEDLHYYSNSLSAARASAGSVIAAVDKVLSGRNRNAFCLVRPPGHMAGMYVCMYGRICICNMRTYHPVLHPLFFACAITSIHPSTYFFSVCHVGVEGMKRRSDKGGLCLLNNVAIGALHALDRCLRIAIIDIGVHHGEGTEEIVRYQGGCRWIDLVNAWMDKFMGGCLHICMYM